MQVDIDSSPAPVALKALLDGSPERLAVVVVLALGLALLLLASLAKIRPGSAANVSVGLLGLGALLISGAVSAWLVYLDKWAYLLALIPCVLIARHAVYLRMIRRASVDGRPHRSPVIDEEEWKRFEPIFERVRRGHERDFSPEALAVRYGVPALLVTVIGLAAFEGVFLHWGLEQVPAPVMGAQYALAGAYVYVLIQLGQRSMRHDLTSGIAMWSAIMMALGPIVGAVLALFFHPAQNADTTWGYQAAYFVAGLSPRYATSVIEETVRRLWLTRAGPAAAPPRTIPLIQIRGIGPEIEDRLSEEGIFDAYGMAMADPQKLYRNTNFDRRLILSWIDEALLITFCPDTWSDIEKQNLTGAIDLASCLSSLDPEHNPQSEAVKALQQATGAASPDSLLALLERLDEDAQVNLIWALYQFEDDGESDARPTGVVVRSAPMTQGDTVGGDRDFAKLGWLLTGASALVGGIAFASGWTVPYHRLEEAAAWALGGASAWLAVEWKRRKFPDPPTKETLGRWAMVALGLCAAAVSARFFAPDWGEVSLGRSLLALSALGLGACSLQALVVLADARTARGKRVEVELQLKPEPAPEDVDITVERVERRLQLEPGRYVIRASAPGYLALAQQMDVSQKPDKPVALELKPEANTSSQTPKTPVGPALADSSTAASTASEHPDGVARLDVPPADSTPASAGEEADRTSQAKSASPAQPDNSASASVTPPAPTGAGPAAPSPAGSGGYTAVPFEEAAAHRAKPGDERATNEPK